MGEGTIYVANSEKKVKKVDADIGNDPGPFLDGSQFEVWRMKNALANGCPAYIIIGGAKYKI